MEPDHPEPVGIVLLCGRSFSGKSTIAAGLAQSLPAVVVSLDVINAERGLHGGNGVPVEEWKRTHEIAQARVREAVDSRARVVIDDTSSPRFLRDGWRQLANQVAVPFALVYVETPVAVSLARHRANRSDPSRPDVSDQVMHEHLRSFEPPTDEEDAIRCSSVSEDLDVAVREIRGRFANHAR